MDPNLRLAVERVNAWHLARLRAQFLAQAAESAPAGSDEAAADGSAPRAASADREGSLDGAAGPASH
jgi:hypothetical protein